MKASQEQLREALRGRVTDHHRFLLRLHLDQIDRLDGGIAEIDQRVEANLAPFRNAVELIRSVPGVGEVNAEAIVAEIGTDMSRFPTAGHLLSWVGLCPRQDESAGKRRSNRLRRGNPWLKTALIQSAWAAKNKKGSYLQAQFLRLKSRRGPQKAVCAVAASLLTAIYHMLKTGAFYTDLGADHFKIVPTKLTHSVSFANSNALASLSISPQPRPSPSLHERPCFLLGARACWRPSLEPRLIVSTRKMPAVTRPSSPAPRRR